MKLLSLERIRSKEKKPSYEYIRSTLLRNHEPFAKARPIADDQVQAHSQNNPSLRESKSTNSVIEALLTTVRNLKRSGSSRSSSSTCSPCRKQGHEAGACWTNPSSKEFKFCQQCQKDGYETSHCRKRKKPALADAVESFLTQLESNIKVRIHAIGLQNEPPEKGDVYPSNGDVKPPTIGDEILPPADGESNPPKSGDENKPLNTGDGNPPCDNRDESGNENKILKTGDGNPPEANSDSNAKRTLKTGDDNPPDNKSNELAERTWSDPKHKNDNESKLERKDVDTTFLRDSRCYSTVSNKYYIDTCCANHVVRDDNQNFVAKNPARQKLKYASGTGSHSR
jgi:hypothetical protein